MKRESDVQNKIVIFMGITFLVALAVISLTPGKLGSLLAITGMPTSSPTGVANVTVSATTYITLPVSSINFGSLVNDANDSTVDGSPAPFQLQNDGTVNVNVTIGATNLFSTSANPSSNYQFACGTGEIACPTGSTITLTNMPANATAVQAVANLPFSDVGDQVEIDIAVAVPSAESAGAKSSTVTFVATQS